MIGLLPAPWKISFLLLRLHYLFISYQKIFQKSYYSNEDIFNLIKTAISLKKKQIGNDEDNKVYKEGLFEKDIINTKGAGKNA